MGCITTHTTRIGGIWTTTCLVQTGDVAKDGIRTSSRRIGGSLSFTVSLVCTVGKPYLRVTPTEMVWVTEEMPASYRVESNTNWKIQ